MSFRFSINECTRAVVSLVGLEAEDQLQLWRMACPVACPGEEEVFIPFNPAGCETLMSMLNNPMFVDVPGTYELRFVEATNPDVRMCVTVYERNCAMV